MLSKYGITFRVMHGHGSATAVHGAAEESNATGTLTVLYVGDWDPSGMHMSEMDLPNRIERYEGNAEIIRVAINHEDVRAGTDVPSFEAESKTRDPRYAWYVRKFGRKCWELDALNPLVLRARVEAEIVDRLDLAAWNRAMEVEAAEIASMSTILKGWPGISMPANKCP